MTKCLNRIYELLQHCAVVFVTHAMPHVSRICTHAIVMHKGEARISTKRVSEAIDVYHNEFKVGGRRVVGKGGVNIKEVLILSPTEGVEAHLPFGERLKIKIALEIMVRCSTLRAKLFVWSMDQRPVVEVMDEEFRTFTFQNNASYTSLEVDIEPLRLGPGRYTIMVAITNDNTEEQYCRMDNAVSFVMGHHVLTDGQVLQSAHWSRQ
jgi:lipopolysaccharide transport system ATP-binding protein